MLQKKKKKDSIYVQSTVAEVIAQSSVSGGLILPLQRTYRFFFFLLSSFFSTTQWTLSPHRQVKHYSGNSLLFLEKAVNIEFKQYSIM